MNRHQKKSKNYTGQKSDNLLHYKNKTEKRSNESGRLDIDME